MLEALSVSLAASAVRDLEEVREYYAEQRVPEVGERVLMEIFHAIEELSRFPERGRMVPEFGQPHLRELIHPPFRIVYRRDGFRLRVVRIWRSERSLRLP